jgi:hypothetical protein
MAETRRKFDRDFKEGAVRLVRETGRPIAQVAKGEYQRRKLREIPPRAAPARHHAGHGSWVTQARQP